jgi:hypothetical protein
MQVVVAGAAARRQSDGRLEQFDLLYRNIWAGRSTWRTRKVPATI